MIRKAGSRMLDGEGHIGRRRQSSPSWTASAGLLYARYHDEVGGASSVLRKPRIEALERAGRRCQTVRCTDCSIDLVGHRPRRTADSWAMRDRPIVRPCLGARARAARPRCQGKNRKNPSWRASNRACEDAYR